MNSTFKFDTTEIDTSNVNVSISWYPYELDHGLPRDESLLKMDRYKQKFGETCIKQMLPQMIETGKQERIHFSYVGKIGATFDSHRLLYYVKEQDLSDHQVLIRTAEQIGFNGNQIKEFLQSNQSEKEVQQEINRSQREGISGVPHFRINDRIELTLVVHKIHNNFFKLSEKPVFKFKKVFLLIYLLIKINKIHSSIIIIFRSIFSDTHK